MINSQLISFKNGLFPYYNGFISATRSAPEGITEVFPNTQLLSILAIIITIASLLFGVYKLAIHLGYFSPNENEDSAPSAPPFPEYQSPPPSAPPIEEVSEEVSEESFLEGQKRLFDEFYPNFGGS